MNSLTALFGCFVIAAVGFAQTTPAPAPASKDGKAAAKSSEKKADVKKADPKIEGTEVARGEKGFLGVQVVNGNFKISFYDLKKKPIAADVARALLRWDPKNKVGQERVVLNPAGDGLSLTAPKPIAPPYNFKLFIVLSKNAGEGEDPAPETYVIDFRG